jgi:hypothetical protein
MTFPGCSQIFSPNQLGWRFDVVYVFEATLVEMLRAKADIYAVDRDGKSPCHVAREGPRKLEIVWREALELAGLDLREVYAKSGVRWTEISPEKKSPKDFDKEMEEILWKIDTEDISHKVCEDMLVKRVQAGADMFYRGSRRRTPTAVARHKKTEGFLKSVLGCCGYDPIEVYARPELHPLRDTLPVSSPSGTSSSGGVTEPKSEDTKAIAKDPAPKDSWQRENQYPWPTSQQYISQDDHRNPWQAVPLYPWQPEQRYPWHPHRQYPWRPEQQTEPQDPMQSEPQYPW